MILAELFEAKNDPNTILTKAARQLYNECMNIGADSGATLEQVTHEMIEDAYIDYDSAIKGDDTEYINIDTIKFNSRVFKAALKNYCKDKVEWKQRELMQLFNGTEINLWRMITAPEDWKPNPTVHPGKYWSWDENAAEAHWGEFSNGHVQWLLHAKATYDQIDWVNTIVKNCHKQWEHEKEITLFDKPIALLDYKRV